jgi:DNA mismatch repair protein MutS
MPPRVSKANTKAAKRSMDDIYFAAYQEYVAKYGPKTAILLQVGKFYEMYDSVNTETGIPRANVATLADLCGGAPEPKATEDPNWNRLFWGFPELALPKYERILVNHGYTVVVISQERDATGEVSGRAVEYVSSPGTYMDPECSATQAVEDRNIVGIHVEGAKNVWYVSSTAFDISTGRCVSMETTVALVDGKPVLDTLEPFWAVYPPAEVVVWYTGAALTENHVRSWYSNAYRGPIHLYEVTEKETAATARGRTEFLHRLYKPDTSLSTAEFLGLERHPEALQTLARLLGFVQDHNPSSLEGLRDHRLWAPEEELLLGNSALEQLAMLPLVKPNECLLHWLQKAYTAPGRRALRQRCLKPITDVEELQRRQDRIEELRQRVTGGEIDKALRGVYDVARLYRRFQLGKGQASDLLQLLLSFERIQQLCQNMEGSLSAVEEEVSAPTYLQKVLTMWDKDRIRQCGTGHFLGLGPAHPWTRGQQPALDALEDEWKALEEEATKLKQTWERLLEDRDKDCVKVEWKEEAPFTFTATKRRATILQTLLKQKRITLDVVTKGSTGAVATLSTPEVETLNRKAMDVWQRWCQAAEAAWKEAWSNFEYNEEILDWVSTLDAEYALARVAEEYGYTKPTYKVADGTAGLSVKELRHPILERVHTTPYIPHSVELGCLVGTQQESETAMSDNGILLYGVNAAGKSSLSKAIGLAVLLAQCGIPVPATEMVIAPYTALFTRILGNDNLWAGMSSFVVEMTEFRSILRSAGPRTLVLGDELCAGTETASAIAIVASGIQTLVNKRTQFVFATHLHELMEMPEVQGLSSVKPYHLTVHAVGGKLVYDRLLKEGAGSPMYGLEVCRGLDMDADFLRRAIEIRKRLEDPVRMEKASRYNASVPVHVCHVCGAKEGLETHHIVPQAAADSKGFVTVGKHKNDVGNLTVLCESCHSKHHAGELQIDGWKDTTGGRLLKYAFKGLC